MDLKNVVLKEGKPVPVELENACFWLQNATLLSSAAGVSARVFARVGAVSALELEEGEEQEWSQKFLLCPLKSASNSHMRLDIKFDSQPVEFSVEFSGHKKDGASAAPTVELIAMQQEFGGFDDSDCEDADCGGGACSMPCGDNACAVACRKEPKAAAECCPKLVDVAGKKRARTDASEEQPAAKKAKAAAPVEEKKEESKDDLFAQKKKLREAEEKKKVAAEKQRAEEKKRQEERRVQQEKKEAAQLAERKVAEEKQKKKEIEKKKATAAAEEEKKKKESKKFESIKKQLPGGLKVEIYRPGKGGATAQVGRKVKVSYDGRLASNGKRFDKGTIEFRLGMREVIAGWDQGVKGMMVGEKRKLMIPPHLAYGQRGAPPQIPKNATLIFDVELLRC